MKLRWDGNSIYVGEHCLGGLSWCDLSNSLREYKPFSHIASVVPTWTESEPEARKALEDAVIEWFARCGFEVAR